MAKQEITKALDGLNENDRKELIKSIISSALEKKETRNQLDAEETIEALKKARNNFLEKYSFKEGDIVKWKPLLKNRQTPEYNEPAIVIKVLENPIYDESEESGSTYWQEPLDLVLGILADGELRTFHNDSRKFQPYKE